MYEIRATRASLESGKRSDSLIRSANGTDGESNREDDPVFVNIVESMEEPQVIISSLVWLETPNNVLRFLPHALYFSVKPGFVLRGERFPFHNREASHTRNGLTAVGLHERPGEMIEGAGGPGLIP
jgi:hypothetical protein